MEMQSESNEVRAEWLDYPSAERYSGLSRTTLWRLVKSERLPAARVGRSVRISRQALDEFMQASAQQLRLF
jgi:excisionase family DNA binding protein